MQTDLPKLTGTNVGGVCHHSLKIVLAEDVETFGDIIENRLATTIALKAGKQWRQFIPTMNTAHPVETFEQQDQGNGFVFEMPFNISKLDRDRKKQLLAYTRKQIILDYTDRNGFRCVVGTPKEPAVLIYNQKSHGRGHHDRNQFDVVIKCSRRHPVPEYVPS